MSDGYYGDWSWADPGGYLAAWSNSGMNGGDYWGGNYNPDAYYASMYGEPDISSVADVIGAPVAVNTPQGTQTVGEAKDNRTDVINQIVSEWSKGGQVVGTGLGALFGPFGTALGNRAGDAIGGWLGQAYVDSLLNGDSAADASASDSSQGGSYADQMSNAGGGNNVPPATPTTPTTPTTPGGDNVPSNPFLDMYTDPRYAAYKNAAEGQYGVARGNILSNLPKGGTLLDALSDVELQRAKALTDYAGLYTQDIADKEHQIELAKLGGNIQLSNTDRIMEAQQKMQEEANNYQLLLSLGQALSDWWG